jgi:cyclic pyranopterin phosphate synthase
MDTFHQMLDQGFNVKINTVVMDGINDQEIIPLCNMTKALPISVRFIEEMPFNGQGNRNEVLKWDHASILRKIQDHYQNLSILESPLNSTSTNYQIDGHQGSIGIIAAYSRLFCGNCNRIRITPTGQMRTCLYGKNVLDLRRLIREDQSDSAMISAIGKAIEQRTKDGYEAEKLRNNQPVSESMSTIGG